MYVYIYTRVITRIHTYYVYIYIRYTYNYNYISYINDQGIPITNPRRNSVIDAKDVVAPTDSSFIAAAQRPKMLPLVAQDWGTPA